MIFRRAVHARAQVGEAVGLLHEPVELGAVLGAQRAQVLREAREVTRHGDDAAVARVAPRDPLLEHAELHARDDAELLV